MKIIEGTITFDDYREYKYVYYLESNDTHTYKYKKLKLVDDVDGDYGHEQNEVGNASQTLHDEVFILLKEGEEIPELIKAIYS